MDKFMVVSYDIKENKRRTRVSKTLLDYGSRVQYSVFECNLNDKHISALMDKLKRIIDQKEDTVRFYTLCQNCVANIHIVGTGELTSDEDVYII